MTKAKDGTHALGLTRGAVVRREELGAVVRRALSTTQDFLAEVGPDVVTFLAPQLWPFAFLAKGAKVLVARDAAALTEARIAGLAATLGELRRRVSGHDVDLRVRLREPDMVFLLGVARDHYAVSQFQSRLARFGAVLAGRAVDPVGDFDEALVLARAALQLNDEAPILLQALEEVWARHDRDVSDARDRGNEHVVARGRVAEEGGARVTQVIPSGRPRSVRHAEDLADSTRDLEASGLVARVATHISESPVVTCLDGTRFRLRGDTLVITPRGRRFLARIRATGGAT